MQLLCLTAPRLFIFISLSPLVLHFPDTIFSPLLCMYMYVLVNDRPRPWTAMGDPGKKTDFLFVHSTGPTHVHRRDTRTKTSIRRHVMRDIGAARRAPRPNGESYRPSRTHAVRSESAFTPLTRPFWDQDPLAILDQHWPMDVFSAYGIALLGTEPKDGSVLSTRRSFLFPFAFTSSAFLRHFGPLYANPALLQAVHRQSSGRARVMALERSVGTISCIEGAIANSGPDFAARDDIVRAVLAVICFNVSEPSYFSYRNIRPSLCVTDPVESC